MRRLGSRGAALILVGLLSTESAQAQGSAIDLLGGLIGAAQAQVAREAWTRVSAPDRFCLQRALAIRNSSIEAVAQSGIGPEDSRLAGFTAQCRRLSEGVQRRNFGCTTLIEDGSSVGTTCDQSYALRESDGSVRPIGFQEAVERHFSGARVFVTEVESEAGRRVRREQAEVQGRVERLQVWRTELANYQRQPSSVLRAEVSRIQTRIEQQLGTRPGPSPSDTEALGREVSALTSLAQSEAARLAALERLSSLRGQAEARTSPLTPETFNVRLASLRAAAAAVSEPPRLAAPAKPVAAEGELGPSFDCTKAVTPLPAIICEDAGLRRLDLEMARPFYALRHLAPAEQAALKAESQELVQRTLTTCRIPETGQLATAARSKAVACISGLYRRQRDAWAKRVEGSGQAAAQQEISRPIREHVRLQDALRAAGFRPSDAVADGVYGSITRRAIIAFGEREGLPSDGFLSNALANRLSQVDRPASVVVGTDPGLIGRINAVAGRYETYLGELSAMERERAAQAQAEARLLEQRQRLEALLSSPVPDDLRGRLTEALHQPVDAAPDARGRAAVLERTLAQLEPRIRDAETIQRAITDRNRFLVEGEGGDLVFLYNSSPRAAGVARGLDGSLLFDAARLVACTLLDLPADRIVKEQVLAKARAIGAPVGDDIPRCTTAQQQSADLVVFERAPVRTQTGLFGTVASAIDTGVFSLAGILPRSDVDAVRQAEAIRASEAESEVARGSSEGLAIIALDNGSRTLCRIAQGEAALHDRLLRPYESLLRGELRGPVTGVRSSPDGAFLSAKRGQCGAIFGTARDLAAFTKALARDSAAFRYLAVWIPPDDVARANESVVATEEARRREREAEEQRRLKDQSENARRAMIDRLMAMRVEAEGALKAGVPPDLAGVLTGFVADVARIGPDTDLAKLKELGDRFADKRLLIDEAARLARAVGPRSRFLLDGDRADLLVLYNDSGKAPSVVRNLRGELVFQDGRAVACFYHPPLADVFLNRQIREKVGSLGAKLDWPLGPCEPAAMPEYDLIVAERDRLLREPVDRVIALATAINGGLYARLTILEAAALSTAKQAEAVRANEVEGSVRARAEGFGIVATSNGSSVVCRVGDTYPEAHNSILSQLSERLADELPSSPTLAPTSADGAFIGVKREECGAVYAPPADLIALTDAMRRDGLRFRFLPIWIAPAEVTRAQQELEAEKRSNIEKQAARERELRSREELELSKGNEEGRRRAALERALRAQHGAMARTFEQALGEEVKSFAAGDRSTFASRYPELARYYQSLKEDRWEFMSSETTISDYGTAIYKDRALEAALATSRIRMRNRILGEYQDLCFVTGYVDDAEFNVKRDAIGIQCDGGDAKLAQYKQGERFTSKWIAP